MKRNFHVRFLRGDFSEITYPNLFIARPIINEKPTLLKLKGLFKYEDQSWRDLFPRFFSYTGFEIFQNREIATGGDAIKKQLTSLNFTKRNKSGTFSMERIC